LGLGPVQRHVDHARVFAAVARALEPESAGRAALDLGTGAGLPGLVLALEEEGRHWTLLDGRERSVAFVREAVEELGLDERVSVVLERAEELGRDPRHRGRYGLVVARGFGPPSVTAECAAPLLEEGGWLLVSEPPASTGERWPAEPLEILGMRWIREVTTPPATVAVLEQVRVAPGRFPRRTGIPAKRPLFDGPRR